ncbi:MAG: hypothetical protein JST68_14680 [Bacteroidetes bacterium]|nr:hypothetical protein [Bacteroidota bacterium]
MTLFRIRTLLTISTILVMSAARTSAQSVNAPAEHGPSDHASITHDPTERPLTAQEIVSKHIEALGGKERLQSINSVFIEGVAVAGNGTSVDTKLWKVYDRLYRQEVSFGGASTVTIVTPSRGWVTSHDSKGGYALIPSKKLRAMQPELDPAGALADYAQKGCRVDLAGRDTVNGHACYRIRLSCPMGQFVDYSIDEKSYLILKEKRNDASSLEFADYKKTPEGYIFPYTIVSNDSGEKMNVERVEVNHSVNVDGLSRPK